MQLLSLYLNSSQTILSSPTRRRVRDETLACESRIIINYIYIVTQQLKESKYWHFDLCYATAFFALIKQIK